MTPNEAHLLVLFLTQVQSYLQLTVFIHILRGWCTLDCLRLRYRGGKCNEHTVDIKANSTWTLSQGMQLYSSPPRQAKGIKLFLDSTAGVRRYSEHWSKRRYGAVSETGGVRKCPVALHVMRG